MLDAEDTSAINTQDGFNILMVTMSVLHVQVNALSMLKIPCGLGGVAVDGGHVFAHVAKV